MRKMLIILLVALLAACSPSLRLQSSQTAATDTVTVTEQVRDTVVVLERDQSMIRALLECDSVGQVQMRKLLEYQARNRLKPPDIEVHNNVLTATAQADSMAIYLTLKDRIERHTSTHKELQVVEVNRLNTWQRTWMRIGQVSALLLILFGVFKTRKLLKI